MMRAHRTPSKICPPTKLSGASLTDCDGRLISGLLAPLIQVIERHSETIPVLATSMVVQIIPPPTRFMFWCTAPFVVATLVILPLVAQPPKPTGRVVMGVVELLALLMLIGFWNPERCWCCWLRIQVPRVSCHKIVR